MTPLSTEALTHFVCAYIHQIAGVHLRDSQARLTEQARITREGE